MMLDTQRLNAYADRMEMFSREHQMRAKENLDQMAESLKKDLKHPQSKGYVDLVASCSPVYRTYRSTR